MPNEINETLLTPEQFFEANNVAGDYIRREDFLKYCEQLRGLLIESGLQIDYMHDKFHTTGTGNSMIRRIEAATNHKIK